MISRRQFGLLALAGARRASGMARIPTGRYLMGTDAASVDARYASLSPRIREMLRCETPRHEVQVAAFEMDRCEVTNREFQAFIEANPEWRPASHYPAGAADEPVTYVTWHATMAYAKWAGKRLPTEAEWEWAARGGLEDAEYPWGNQPPSPERANYRASGFGRAVAVGQYPANGYGLFDMAGNVWEFCLDVWRPTYDGQEVTTRRVIRGGSWGGDPVNLRVSFRDSHPAEGPGPHVGFRCVR